MNFVTSRSLEVLYFLLSDPMEQFHEREISRKTSVSIGAVSQFLRKFHTMDLVDLDRRGRTNLYRANLRNPAARQFKILFNVLSLNGLVNTLKQASERIVLFGSCAEGIDVKDSDIDLFILASNPEAIRLEAGMHEQMTDRRIAPIIVDSNELAKMKARDKPLYERISKGITLWEHE